MQAKVEVTTRCNLECIHCSASTYRPAPDWKTDQLVRTIEHLIAEGYTDFHLQGGEPFIRSDIFQMLNLFEDHENVRFSFASNSLLLNEEKIKKLLLHKRLSTFTISLDGALKETHETMRGENTYEHTLKMMKLVAKWKYKLKAQTNFNLNFTLTKINHQEIEQIFRTADQLGFDRVVVLSLSPMGNAAENLDKLLLSEKEEFAALQKGAHALRKINIARQAKGLNPLQFDVNLFPYTWKCKLMKWSRDFTNGRTQVLCGTGTSTIYVGADGTIFPCEGVRTCLDVVEREIGSYEKPNIKDYTITEAKKTESFKRIVAFLRDYDKVFGSIEPCNTCEHLGKCNICPLFALMDGGVPRCAPEVLT